ncbi:ATP-binding protein [Kitasatospora sp. NPDC101235]|uniref:ATP-binding protein n=1 Tax=Kitasatospora sp. NPDC101235 TaxID=3364101 RepID=UPI0037FD7C0F
MATPTTPSGTKPVAVTCTSPVPRADGPSRARERSRAARTLRQGARGKNFSDLLIGIGTAIAEASLSVRHTTASALVNELAEADAGRRLSSVIARYSKIDLLCPDEFGYLNLDRKGAKLLFQIFTERKECKATAVATNSPFTEWDKTFGDTRLCAAIADRITFRCTLIQTGTDSYRYQATQEGLFAAPR